MAKIESLRPVRAAIPGLRALSAAGPGVLRRAGLAAPLTIGLLALLPALALGLLLWLQPPSASWLAPLLVLLQALAVVAAVVAGLRLKRQLLAPLAELEYSLGRVCQGEPHARIDCERVGALGGLVADVESLNEELSELYDDMDERVERQTRRLAQKTASLKILYEVAASLNHTEDLTQLLVRYLRTLKEMVNGRSATVYVREPGGRLRLVASIGEENQVLLEHEMLPLSLCRCGHALVPGEVLCEHDAEECSRRNHRPMFGPGEMEVVEVPMDYHDENLGLYRIFVERPGIGGREDVLELLTTIGSHLSIAIAKQRSDREARRLSIMDERNHLAHELHDSLAQTLASLRFQVRMLQETLGQGQAGEDALNETRRIRNSLDEAHTELRELLDSFRAPVDRRGLVPTLEKLVERFRDATGLLVFFQQDCRQLQLSAQEEMQMLRVVQESLANIRKHAHARTVRILLRCRAPGSYLLLVEDDGVGFDRQPLGARPGEHIGLSIMEERSRRIGAELRIESEPGEGTRVEMVFEHGRRMGTAKTVELQ